MRELLLAALGELLLHEHRGGDLAAGDVDHRRGLAVREADRIEHEHVALEGPGRDAALGHRGDQVLVGDALEQRQAADEPVRVFETRR